MTQKKNIHENYQTWRPKFCQSWLVEQQKQTEKDNRIKYGKIEAKGIEKHFESE